MHVGFAVSLALAACVPNGRGTQPASNGRYLTSAEINAIPTAFPTTLVPPKSARLQPMCILDGRHEDPALGAAASHAGGDGRLDTGRTFSM